MVKTATSILAFFKPLTDWIGFDKPEVSSIVLTLTTKVTVLWVLGSSLLAGVNTFFGDPIDCMVEEVPEGVIDTYCWIHSTFILPKRITSGDGSDPMKTGNPHPGVGAPEYEEVTTNLTYYQWVVFTLLFQAGLFYMPKRLWILGEKKMIENLIPDALFYKVTDKRMPYFPKPRGAVKDKDIEEHVNTIREYLLTFYGRPGVNRHKRYLTRFLFCEILCFVTIVFNIAFIDLFLGGMFSTYGNMVWEISEMDPEDRRDPMDLVFPKVAKCNFYRQGPTGTIQNRDALCVLPVNIFNEKIYIFLWFWLVNLAWFTALCLIVRWVSLLVPALQAWELRTMTHNLIDASLANRLVNKCRKGEIFFLTQLGKNLDPYIFAKLCTELDKSLTKRNEQAFDSSVPNGTPPPPSDSLYPALTSPNAAEKEAEAAASAAAAVEAALEAAAERIEMQDMNEGNNEYLKHSLENPNS